MGTLSWLVMGLIAGVLAKIVLPGAHPGGLLVTLLIGVAGAFLGGFLGTKLGFGTVTGFNLVSILLALGGAIILLVVYRLLRRIGG